MNLKIINIFSRSFRNNLKYKNLINLFDELEPNPEECSKETALTIINSMGDDYKTQISNLQQTDLDFLYVTKDTRNNCFYINCPIYDLEINVDNLFNNNATTFRKVSYILNVVEYCNIVIYAII